jgi:hypothetical protein
VFIEAWAMFIVICDDRRPTPLILHTKFSGDCISLFFTMRRVDFAGEFFIEIQ